MNHIKSQLKYNDVEINIFLVKYESTTVQIFSRIDFGD